MPCVQIKVVNNQATLAVALFPDGKMQERTNAKSNYLKIKNPFICQALIDTGATNSGIAVCCGTIKHPAFGSNTHSGGAWHTKL